MNNEYVSDQTTEDKKLINYMADCIANYLEKNETDRSVMMSFIGWLAVTVFTRQTPLVFVEQIKEIEAFCEFLKYHAIKHRKLN